MYMQAYIYNNSMLTKIQIVKTSKTKFNFHSITGEIKIHAIQMICKEPVTAWVLPGGKIDEKKD